MEDCSGSPVHQDFVNKEGDPITNVSTADGSCFAVESNMYTDDIDARRNGDHADGTMAIEGGHYHDKDEVVECVGVSGNTINDYSTENSDKERVDEEADAPSLKLLSAVVNHNDWSIEASDHETKDAHPFDESANEGFGNSQLEKTELVSQEMGSGSFSPQNEMDEYVHPPRMASFDNGEDNGKDIMVHIIKWCNGLQISQSRSLRCGLCSLKCVYQIVNMLQNKIRGKTAEIEPLIAAVIAAVKDEIIQECNALMHV